MTRRLAASLVVVVFAASCAGRSDDASPGGADLGTTPTSVFEDPVTRVTVSADPDATEPATSADSVPDDEPQRATTEREPSETDEPAWVSGSSALLFDQASLHTFEIDVSPENLANLDADPAEEEYVEGSLRFNGEIIDPVGVRYKGSVGAFLGCTAGPNPLVPSGEKTCRKLSMKLKINWKDPNREFYGVRKVQLHSQNLDQTKMHERLGYWLFREAGVPAPRSTHARVVLNGEYLGLFALTEQIDGRFTRENFDDGTGNLYKEVWPIDADGAVRAESALRDGLETNEDDNASVEPIRSFAQAVIDDGTDALDDWTDREQLLTAFVVDRLIANDDGPLHWYCFEQCQPHNFYWYEEPTDGSPGARLHLIPWDLDNAFANLSVDAPEAAITKIADPWGVISNDCQRFPFGPLGIPQRSAACDPIIAAAASLSADYERIRAEILAGPFSEASVNDLLDTWSEQIEPAIIESEEAFDDATTVEQWRIELQRFEDVLADARIN